MALRGSYDALLCVDYKPVVKVRSDSVVAKYLKGTTTIVSFSVAEI